ncbi:MAG: flagellar biosynthesis repressor FlbT [Parvibaculaceae bacterium]
MSASIRISLQAGERIFVNGAVLRVDRKVSLEFLNDVTFLLEHHVMQPEDATTPLKQLYFALQTMLLEPETADKTRLLFARMHAGMLAAFENPRILSGLKFADGMVSAGRIFEALKTIRGLFSLEEAVLERRDDVNLQINAAAPSLVA